MHQLSEDLIACRRRLKISLEDISKSTRVPVSLFASIEDGSFFSNPAFTRTYIRSFTRMYARAIKIEEADIVRALDLDESGAYDGFLLRKYVQGVAEPSPKVAPAQEAAPAPPAAAEYKRPAPPETPEPPAPPRTPILTDRNVDWANTNARINQPKRSNSTAAYLIGAAVLLVAAAAILYFFFNPISLSENEGLSPASETTDTAPRSDTNAVVAPPPAPRALPSLPDTLIVTVYAYYDKLDPVRVTSDLKDRVNPYWIERGTARQFTFRDSIELRAPFNRYILMYNGHVVGGRESLRFGEDPLNILVTRAFIGSQAAWATPGSLPDSIPNPRQIQ